MPRYRRSNHGMERISVMIESGYNGWRNYTTWAVQIWRQNYSQPGTYYKAQSDIIMNGASGCASWVTIAMGIHFCILKSMAVSVQPGDFLGLEIPRTDGIYFTSGGPENYRFRSSSALSSSVEFINNSNYRVTVGRQRPQIAFSLTSGTIYTDCLPLSQ